MSLDGSYISSMYAHIIFTNETLFWPVLYAGLYPGGGGSLCLKDKRRTISLFLHQKCLNVNSSGHKEPQNCNFQPPHAIL